MINVGSQCHKLTMGKPTMGTTPKSPGNQPRQGSTRKGQRRGPLGAVAGVQRCFSVCSWCFNLGLLGHGLFNLKKSGNFMGYSWDNDSDNGDKTGHRTNYCPIWVCLKLGYSPKRELCDKPSHLGGQFFFGHSQYEILSNWWFGTFFMTFHSIGNFILPTDFHSIIFQRGRLKPPTSHSYIP